MTQEDEVTYPGPLSKVSARNVLRTQVSWGGVLSWLADRPSLCPGPQPYVPVFYGSISMGSTICSNSPLLSQNLESFLMYPSWEFSPWILILVNIFRILL